jgi:hypothetical protein
MHTNISGRKVRGRKAMRWRRTRRKRRRRTCRLKSFEWSV